MRRRMLVAAVAGGALLVPAAPAVPRTTAVGVALDEFRVAPYRDRVKPGTVKFNVANLGEDIHNLVVRRRGSTRIAADSGELRPGERLTFRVKLPNPGRFHLVCTIADHESIGMRSRLTVTRRAR